MYQAKFASFKMDAYIQFYMAKIVIVLLIGLVGGVLISNFFNIQISPKQTATLTVEPTSTTENLTAVPTAITASPTTTPTTVKTATEKGTIEIKLGYPAGGIPALKVCLFAIPAKVGDYASATQCVTTPANQTQLTMTAPVGSYHIFAWPDDNQYQLSGSWTPAVACGLSVDCKDHSPLAVVVNADQKTTGVAIQDWYGEGVGYPKKP